MGNLAQTAGISLNNVCKELNPNIYLALYYPGHPYSDHAAFKRLEWRGDSELQRVVTILLLLRFPYASLHELTIWRGVLVSNKYLARMARECNLNLFIHTVNGRVNDTVLANTTEALLGAISIDCGYEALCRVIEAEMSCCIDFITTTLPEGFSGWEQQAYDGYHTTATTAKETASPSTQNMYKFFVLVALELSSVVVFGTIAMLLLTKPPFLRGITYTEPTPLPPTVTQQVVSFFTSWF